MADERIRQSVKITDPLTDANEAGVDASGNLQVVVNAAIATGSNTIGAVNLAEHGELDDDPVAVNGALLMAGLVFDDTTPIVVEEGDAGYQRMSLNRNAYGVIRDDAGNERGANVTAANELTVLATAQPGIDIGDVDVLSVIPGVAATSLGKAEDAVHGDGDTGVMLLAVRRDADTTLVDLTGDYAPLQVDVDGRLKVETQAGAAGTSAVDDAAFTAGTDLFTPIGGMFDDTTPNDLEENDAGVVRMSTKREMYTNIRDGAGNERSTNVTAANELNVIATAQPGVDIGDVDVLSLPTSPDTLAEDTNFAAAAIVFPMGAQFDDAAINVLDEDDIGAPRMSANRNLYQTIRDAAGSERGVNVTAAFELNVLATAQPGVDIGDVDILSGPTGASAFEVQGTAADGAAAVGNPVLVGGEEAGGNVQSLHVDSSGDLQVDILSGGGEAIPIGDVLTEASSTNTAAGVSFDVDGPSADGTTRKVRGFVASASVPIKAELIQVDNDVDTPHVTLFARAGEAIIYNAPHRDYHEVVFGSTAGFDGFTLRITNLDNTQAADLYGTLYTED